MTPEMRTRIVMEAREWIDTPYRHQASLKGVAVDCWGLIRGVGKELGIIDVDPVRYRQFKDYGRLPNPARMGKGLACFLNQIPPDHADAGDICWLAWRKGVPMHLGIIGRYDDRLTLIHAEGVIGRTTELAFVSELRDMVHSWWRFPGV